MFGRATITLGIGPHSSSCIVCDVRAEHTAEVGLDFVRNDAVVPQSLGPCRRRSPRPRQRHVALRRRRRCLTTSMFAMASSFSPAISTLQPPARTRRRDRTSDYPPAQRGEARWMFSAASVCLSVCLFVCPHDNLRTIKRRTIKLGG